MDRSTQPAHMRSARFYRDWMKPGGLVRFDVRVAETDLAIMAESDLTARAAAKVVDLRNALLDYADAHDGFQSSLSPLEAGSGAPEVVRRMCEAGAAWDVGPFAAVAGTFAAMVGEDLLEVSGEVIVENGGDVFVATSTPREISIYAGGESPFAGKLAVRLTPESGIHGVCTSSGTIGHSLSRGKAEAVVAFAESAAFADAAATAIANRVSSSDDVEAVVEAERKRARLSALVIVAGDKLGAFGDVEFV